MRIRRAAALAALVLLAAAPAARADAPTLVDGRFEDKAVISGLDAPTTMRIAPDGDIYVAEKSGLVLRFSGQDHATSEVVVDLRTEVADYVDRGLLGMELDPGFDVNRRMYLLYTYDGTTQDSAPRGTDCVGLESGCTVSGKLVRVTLPALGQPQPQDITPLIEHEWCQQFTSHSIGTVLFGPDGALYAGAGEGANFDQVDYGQFGDPPNPCGDPPGGKGTANSSPTGEGGSLRSQDVRTHSATDPTGLDGTIIRVDPDTGAPLGAGPFTADTNARRIVAYGFRNPFRFTFRPGTRELWVGDVGQTKVEEIDRIPDAAGGLGQNFGWPCREGDDFPPDWQPLNLCKSLTSSVSPYFSYRHSRHVATGDGCPLDMGSALSGVAFQTAASGWPPEFDGALFFSDFARGCIWVLPKGSDGLPDPTAARLFAHGSPQAGAIDMRVGPDGALYYVYWNPAVADGSAIHRIAFTGHAPHAALTATPTEGDAPLAVHLDARGSNDPDVGQALHYAWDLDGDGTFGDGPDQPQLDHTFAEVRDVPVSVRVTDPDGLTSTATVTIQAGNTAPAPLIDAPADGTVYSVGDRIDFHGSATDRQDGELDASRLSWNVQLAHCPSDCHRHPLMSVDGVAGGFFAAPDHELPSFVEITLTAKDSRGLSTSVTRRIDPRVATVRVATDPAGIPVRVLGHAEAPAPQQASVIDGAQASIAVPATAVVGGATRTFLRWEDGSTDRDRVVTVHGALTRTAIYSAPPGPTVLPPDPSPWPGRPLNHPFGVGLRLDAPRRLHLARRLHVGVGCVSACRVRTTATLRVPGPDRRLRVAARTVLPTRDIRLGIPLGRSRVAAARRALRAGRKVSLRLVLAGSNVDGFHQRRTATIRLVR
jgi:glucose/arabinose dehydrogenase/PKD repeat protein